MGRRLAIVGFTLVELLVVIVIIGILAAILLPAISKAICASRDAGARTIIGHLDVALTQYHNDFGIYPPGDGSGSKDLVTTLKSEGPRKQPYYEFKDDDIDSNGNLRSPVIIDDYFKYRENESKKTKTADMHRKNYYDIWLKSCKDNGVAEDGINNWQY